MNITWKIFKLVSTYPLILILIILGCLGHEIKRAWRNFNYINSVKTEIKKYHKCLKYTWKNVMESTSHE